MVFYRKYRPQKLEELFGQEEIVKSLLAQLNSGNIGQGYLFWGPKGTGKTSTARILAKAVNCERNREKFGEPCGKCANCTAIAEGSFIDLIEIDGASNRGIDEIRDLREKVKLAPAIGKYKVYIIDEVHMLTTEAFNALLKTLEEPPKHVIFILATTEYSKLPPTITSRLMKFNFKRANNENLKNAIENVAKKEKIKIEDLAVSAIADASEGSFRDALSILDQVSSEGPEVKLADVKSLVRLGGADSVQKFANFIAQKKLKEAVLFVDEFSKLGLDVSAFVRQTILFFEKLLYIKIGIGAQDVGWTEDEYSEALEFSEKFATSEIKKIIAALAISEGEMSDYPEAQIPVVLAVCKILEDVTREDRETEARESNVEEKPLEEPSSTEKDEAELSSKPKSVKKSMSISLAEVEKSWSEFLNRIRPVNAHVFALLRSTKPSSFDGEAVTLEVFYRFHKDKLEEPKIIKMLDSHLEEILGKKVRLRFTLAKKETAPTTAVKRSDVVESAPEDLEKMAHEIFSK